MRLLMIGLITISLLTGCASKDIKLIGKMLTPSGANIDMTHDKDGRFSGFFYGLNFSFDGIRNRLWGKDS